MAVLIMYEWEKNEAASLYKTRFHSIERLARYYNVSTSTMWAALKEQGAVKSKPVLSVEEHQMVNFLRTRNFSLKKLQNLVDAQIIKGNQDAN